jgi:F0F1-type ATP synthase membrane subunit b/b'
MNRVKGLLAGTTPTSGITETSIGGVAGPPIPPDAPDQSSAPSDAGTPHHALQVLTLAQRTADEHLASARQDAEKIRAEARATAEMIAREAQQHADNVRKDANKMLVEARESAAQTARQARSQAADQQRQGDQALAEAQAKAEAIAADARATAEELRMQAEQRYHDVVGSLANKREALQQQIESLEQFDREYRARLTAFMQHQLRALWVDQPQVADELDAADGEVPTPPQRNGSDPAKQRA